MRIQFERLTIARFGSFAAEQTLELGALEEGVHFIRGENYDEKGLGPNGAGKSTMVNALCWCLYGQTTNGLKSSDIKPWRGHGKPTVTVVCKFDGKRRTIQRVAPGFITIDDKEVGQSAIDDLMHMGFNVFKQTILFGQKESLFFDLPNKGKLELLSDVLELDKWNYRSQMASERTRELEQNASTQEVGVQTLEDRIEYLRRTLQTQAEAGQEWELALADKLKTIGSDNKRLKAEHAEASKKLATATRIAKLTAERLGEAQASMAIAKGKLDDLDKQQVRAGEKARNLKKQLEQTLSDIELLKVSKLCPTCNQPISAANLAGHKKNLLEQAEEFKVELQNIEWPAQGKMYCKIKAEWTQVKAAAVGYQADFDASRNKVNELKPKLAGLAAEMATLEKFIKVRERERNPYAAQLVQMKLELQQQKVNLGQQKDLLDKTKRRAVRARYWIKGFKDIRLYVVEQMLQELELVTNTMLHDMGLVDWKVSYAVERATQTGTVQTGMQVSIMSPRNKKLVKWEVWSGGESQRLRLAGAMALSEVLLSHANIEVDLEILDEPTVHLSDEGVRDLGEMLADRAYQIGRRILYIDHAAYEGSQFTSTVTVRRDGEGSQILM